MGANAVILTCRQSTCAWTRGQALKPQTLESRSALQALNGETLRHLLIVGELLVPLRILVHP